MARLLSPGAAPRSRLNGFSHLATLTMLAAALILLAGCGAEAPRRTDLSSGEKLAYISRPGANSLILLNTTGGGEGEALLTWAGFGERFSFSNDGRYLAAALIEGEPADGGSNAHFVLAATDGASAYEAPGGLTFSPDGARAAYITVPDGGNNELGILDVAGGRQQTLVRGSVLINPTWIDAGTLVYTELEGTGNLTNKVGGTVYRLDLGTGASTALTPPGRSFSTYHAPVSFPHEKLVLTEKGPLNNLWSLEVHSGELGQITNNDFFQFRAGYLPGDSLILFEMQKNPEDLMSSEIAIVSDSGDEYRQLTRNFFFDGLHSYSLKSGTIVYQQKDEKNATSIWIVNQDGSAKKKIAESTGWLGDPNFAPVEGWRLQNPLVMVVDEARPDAPVTVRISNPAAEPVEAVLRAFAGIDLMLAASETCRQEPGAGDRGGSAGAPTLSCRLTIQPGGTSEIVLDASPRPTVAIPTRATLLLTLAVPGSPPRMYWRDFGGPRPAPR